jgi:hypothetical protein
VTNHQAESDANMPLLSCLSRTWSHIQGNLFPWLTEELGPLTETHKQVVTALEVAGVEAFVQAWSGLPGRPPCDRAALARAFVAKAVIGLPTTSTAPAGSSELGCRIREPAHEPRALPHLHLVALPQFQGPAS